MNEKKRAAEEKLAQQGSKDKDVPKKEPKEKKPKVIFEVKNVCPHCKKKIITKKTKKLVKAAIPAEYDEKFVVEKDAQKTIQEVSGPKLDKKEKNKLHG